GGRMAANLQLSPPVPRLFDQFRIRGGNLKHPNWMVLLMIGPDAFLAAPIHQTLTRKTRRWTLFRYTAWSVNGDDNEPEYCWCAVPPDRAIKGVPVTLELIRRL